MKTIVLARTDMTGLRDTGQLERRDGVNWFPKFEPCPKASALVWLNEGTEADEAQARDFAQREGYSVLIFPTSEPDPLGKARAAVLAKAS